MKTSICLLLALAIHASVVHRVYAQIPAHITQVRVALPEVSQNNIILTVKFGLSVTAPIEFSAVKVYTVAAHSNEVVQRRTTGLFHNAPDSAGEERAKRAPFQLKLVAGVYEVGTSISGAAGQELENAKAPSITAIQGGLEADQNYWCLEIMPTFSGQLLCTAGASFEDAQENALRDADMLSTQTSQKIAEVKAAAAISPEYCKFVGRSIPETLRARIQCVSDCWSAHGGISTTPPEQATPQANCEQACQRVTPDQLMMVRQAFTVCAGLVPEAHICKLGVGFLKACGMHIEQGCQELSEIVEWRCPAGLG